MKPFWLLGLFVLACSAPARSPSELARSCLSAARVESEFIEEALRECAKYDVDDASKCPVFPGIDAKYEPLRKQALESCRQ